MILGQACAMILFQVYVEGFLEKHAIRQVYVLESRCASLIIFDLIVFFRVEKFLLVDRERSYNLILVRLNTIKEMFQRICNRKHNVEQTLLVTWPRFLSVLLFGQTSRRICDLSRTLLISQRNTRTRRAFYPRLNDQSRKVGQFYSVSIINAQVGLFFSTRDRTGWSLADA